MAQTTTDTAASTVSGAGAASSFSGGTGTEAEFGSLGALSPTWWEPEDGSEPEPWLTELSYVLFSEHSGSLRKYPEQFPDADILS